MDDQRLAEQPAKTGNLMDVTYKDDWWDADTWDSPVEARRDGETLCGLFRIAHP